MLKARVNFKKLNESAIVPTYGTEFSAGADLYALPGEPVNIPAHKTVLIHTVRADIKER